MPTVALSSVATLVGGERTLLHEPRAPTRPCGSSHLHSARTTTSTCGRAIWQASLLTHEQVRRIHIVDHLPGDRLARFVQVRAQLWFRARCAVECCQAAWPVDLLRWPSWPTCCLRLGGARPCCLIGSVGVSASRRGWPGRLSEGGRKAGPAMWACWRGRLCSRLEDFWKTDCVRLGSYLATGFIFH